MDSLKATLTRVKLAFHLSQPFDLVILVTKFDYVLFLRMVSLNFQVYSKMVQFEYFNSFSKHL